MWVCSVRVCVCVCVCIVILHSIISVVQKYCWQKSPEIQCSGTNEWILITHSTSFRKKSNLPTLQILPTLHFNKWHTIRYNVQEETGYQNKEVIILPHSSILMFLFLDKDTSAGKQWLFHRVHTLNSSSVASFQLVC
jgi:hypothetical protein